MTHQIDQSAPGRSLLDIVERASLFALLQQSLQHAKRPPEVPPRLQDDVGMQAIHTPMIHQATVL